MLFFEEPGLYLNRPVLARRRLSVEKVKEAARDWVAARTGVLEAFTNTQIIDGLPATAPHAPAAFVRFAIKGLESYFPAMITGVSSASMVSYVGGGVGFSRSAASAPANRIGVATIEAAVTSVANAALGALRAPAATAVGWGSHIKQQNVEAPPRRSTKRLARERIGDRLTLSSLVRTRETSSRRHGQNGIKNSKT